MYLLCSTNNIKQVYCRCESNEIRNQWQVSGKNIRTPVITALNSTVYISENISSGPDCISENNIIDLIVMALDSTVYL